MLFLTKLILAGVFLTGCAATYEPDHAGSIQDQARNSNPELICEGGAVVACDIEGGGLVGKTYGNCHCAR